MEAILSDQQPHIVKRVKNVVRLDSLLKNVPQPVDHMTQIVRYYNNWLGNLLETICQVFLFNEI